jgi:general secretion pathway protein D
VVLGGVQTATLSSTSAASLGSLTGLLGGVLGPALGASSLLGTSFPSYGLVFQALGTKSNARILSAPSIIALDNEEAKYSVGTSIPVINGTVPVSATNPTTLTTTNISHEPLDLVLDIKPHISTGDTVLLEVKHSNKDLVSEDSKLGPTWSTRNIETRVVVRDQQTVVIGGLMQEKTVKNSSGVPVLSDLPLLGYLFRYTTSTKRKTNLLVMLTPYIIKDQLDLELIRSRRMRESEEFTSSLKHLDGMKLDRSVDYARKRGLLEEINRDLISIDDEAAQRAQIVRPAAVPAGPVAPAPTEH